jgi:hypothetical protein
VLVEVVRGLIEVMRGLVEALGVLVVAKRVSLEALELLRGKGGFGEALKQKTTLF